MKYHALAFVSAIAGAHAATNSIDDEAVKYEQYRANDFALRRICNSFKWVERGNILSCTGYGMAGYLPGVPLDNAQWHNLWEAWELSRGTDGGSLYKIALRLTEFNRGDAIWFNWENWKLIAEDQFDFSAETGFKYYTGTEISLENTPDILRQAAEKPGDKWIKVAEENWSHGNEALGDDPIFYERFNNRLSQLDYTLGRGLTLREMKFDDVRYTLDSLANMVAGLPAADSIFVDLSRCPSN